MKLLSIEHIPGVEFEALGMVKERSSIPKTSEKTLWQP